MMNHGILAEALRGKLLRMRHDMAFTLIELLIVIVIIAILSSILLPAFSAAKEKAKTVECMSRLKQCAYGLSMYSMDNNGAILIYWYDGARESRWSAGLYQNDYIKDINVLKCASWPSVYFTASNLSDCYGMFGTLPAYCVDNKTGVPRWTVLLTKKLKSPSSFMMNADSNVSRTADEKRQYASIYTTGDFLFHLRHQNRANVSYADGHVSLESSSKLQQNLSDLFAKTVSFSVYLGSVPEKIDF